MTIESFTSDSVPIPSRDKEEENEEQLKQEEPQPSTRRTKSTICTHCGSLKSPLWRRGQHNEVLCNACGLYWKHHSSYRPLDGSLVSRSARQSPKPKPASIRRPASAIGSLSTVTTNSNLQQPPLAPFLISNTRKRKERIDEYLYYIKSGNGKWRGESSLIPKPSSDSLSHILSNSAFCPFGKVKLIPATLMREKRHLEDDDYSLKYTVIGRKILFIGDFCAIKADDSNIYYIIIKDFWISEGGYSMAIIQWLLPKAIYALEIDGHSTNIKEWMFDRGIEDENPLKIEDYFVDVFYSPRRDVDLHSILRDDDNNNYQDNNEQYLNPTRPEAIRSDCIADLKEMEQIAAAMLCEFD